MALKLLTKYFLNKSDLEISKHGQSTFKSDMPLKVVSKWLLKNNTNMTTGFVALSYSSSIKNHFS